MNIGLFTDTYFPQLNGVATSVHTLADALKQRGHNVYIFTPSDPRAEKNEDISILRMPSIPFLMLKNYRIGMLYTPITLNKINHLKLDIVHTQTEFPLGMFGKFLSITQQIPMIHTYHTMYQDYVHYIAHGKLITPSMAKEFSKVFCNTAQAVIAPTQKAKDFLEECGVTKPMRIIPTGIDTSRFSKSNFSHDEILSLRKSLGLDEDTPTILSLGRVAKEKSIDVILKGLPALLKKLPQTKMVIVGDGPERENLEILAKNLGISQNVIFAGARPWEEIGKYYQIGTVFVSASLSETQGLTFAEAMAGGIPVVAKKDASIEAIVKHNVTGLLFEEDEQIADALYTVLTDASLRQRLSDTSLEVMEQLSVENFVNNVEKLYYEVLEGALFQPKKSVLPSLPIALGVKTVKKIGSVPHKIVRSGLRKTGVSIGHFPMLSAPVDIESTTLFAQERKEATLEPIYQPVISNKMEKLLISGEMFNAMFEDSARLIQSYGEENIYDFSIGNPSAEPPASVKKAILSILEEESSGQIYGYTSPAGLPEVRRSIADSINQEFSSQYTEQNIIMTCSASGALNTVLKTLLNPQDEVIIFAPYFGDYEAYIENYDGVMVVIPPDYASFQPNLEKFELSITPRTKAVIINSPNNPSGVIYSAKTLENISQILRTKQELYGHAIFLIADEPYRKLAFDGIEVPFVPDFYDNTLICYSFSKALSLPGARIGYILAPSTLTGFHKIIAGLTTANRVTVIHAPTLFQKVIPHCLKETADLETYDKNRKYFYNMLTELGYHCSYPEGAFYLFPKSPIEDEKAFCKEAQEHRILIVPGSAFGCPGYFRISYCVPYETIVNSYAGFQALAEKYLR